MLAGFALCRAAAERRRRAASAGRLRRRHRHRRLPVRDLRRPAPCGRRCSAIGATLIGFGGGLFSVGTLTAAMAISDDEDARRPHRPRARRLGRGAGDLRGRWRSRSARSSAISSRRRPSAGDLGPTLAGPVDRLCLRLRRSRSCCCSARSSRSGRLSGGDAQISRQPIALRPQRISGLKGESRCIPLSPPASMSPCWSSRRSSCSSSAWSSTCAARIAAKAIRSRTRPDRPARHRRRPAAHRVAQDPSCCPSATASSPRRPRGASRSTSRRAAPNASPARLMRRRAIRWSTASARRPGPTAPSVPTSTWTAIRASSR